MPRAFLRASPCFRLSDFVRTFDLLLSTFDFGLSTIVLCTLSLCTFGGVYCAKARLMPYGV